MALVSVIVAAHNVAEYLPDCLRSIETQTYRPIEVCIHNDASTDDTQKFIQKWSAQLRSELSVESSQLLQQDDEYNAISSGNNLEKKNWAHEKICDHAISVSLTETTGDIPRGPAYARNIAITNSKGKYLCILDADDIMEPNRIQLQLERSKRNPSAIIGAKFSRIPYESTKRYTTWANSLDLNKLYLHRFRECTIIQPTWFMPRAIFEKVGGYVESLDAAYEMVTDKINNKTTSNSDSRIHHASNVSNTDTRIDNTTDNSHLQESNILNKTSSDIHKRHRVTQDTQTKPTSSDIPDTDAISQQYSKAPVPEDLVFFLRHLELGGTLDRVNQHLVQYRYNPQSMSYRIHRTTLLKLRARFLERHIFRVNQWETFIIWSAGRDGKALFKAFSPECRKRVVAFADIAPSKVGTKYHNANTGESVDIIHVDDIDRPFVTCVALDRTNGKFENTLENVISRLKFNQGIDFWVFN